MNKKIIAASLLSTFAVGATSDIGAKNKIIKFIDSRPQLSIFAGSSIITLLPALIALLAINKLNGSESEKSDWFTMLGGTQKDIDDYKNLLKSYEATKNSLTGSAKKAFDEDVEIIDKDIPRTFVGLDEKYRKYNDLLGRVLKVCALNNNPFRSKGHGQYGQGYNFWCAVIIKKFASNNGSISEDAEAKVYFVYKSMLKALLPLFDKTGDAKAPTDEIYSDLYKNFLNNLLAIQLSGCFSTFLTGDDKLLLMDKVISNATKNGNFDPEVVLQTMVDKLYEIILEHNDSFLDYYKKDYPNEPGSEFEPVVYCSMFVRYMKNTLGPRA